MRFSLRTLGARPVDFSDPVGRLDRIRREMNTQMPWFGRITDGGLISYKLVELHGKLDVGHILPSADL